MILNSQSDVELPNTEVQQLMGCILSRRTSALEGTTSWGLLCAGQVEIAHRNCSSQTTWSHWSDAQSGSTNIGSHRHLSWSHEPACISIWDGRPCGQSPSASCPPSSILPLPYVLPRMSPFLLFRSCLIPTSWMHCSRLQSQLPLRRSSWRAPWKAGSRTK